MITGDHPHTALAVARELGIAGEEDLALSGSELDRLDDASLGERVAVYARVTAAHKLKIVRAWKTRGGVVAMTGDGVNDAPAIKGADIGIAMGRSGTEVTKEASDMVITDDNFASIVAAVEEGRGIYDNIKKTMQYLLAGNVGELILMTACVLIGLPMPLLASMALTFWAPHNAWLGSFLKVEPMSMSHCLLLLAVGAIPLLVLEAWKFTRHTKENAT